MSFVIMLQPTGIVGPLQLMQYFPEDTNHATWGEHLLHIFEHIQMDLEHIFQQQPEQWAQ